MFGGGGVVVARGAGAAGFAPNAVDRAPPGASAEPVR